MVTRRARARTFRHRGESIAYSVFGSGDRSIVLLPGLLVGRRMHQPLAEVLADRGLRVVTMDFLGHGESSRPAETAKYSIGRFAFEVQALLDHLGIAEAVIGGTSLGANVSLEVAARYPARVRGLVLEMPVLEHGLLAAAITFTPLLVGLTLAEPAMRGLAWAARKPPRRWVPFYAGVALDVLAQDPRPSAAVLQGLFFGRIAPPVEERKAIAAPALVIGHRRDPIHPFSDAGMVAAELPRGRLVEATSLVELRFRPERLTEEIASFVGSCWARGQSRRRGSG